MNNTHRFLALLMGEDDCHTVKLDLVAPDDAPLDEITLAARRCAAGLATGLGRTLGWVMTEAEFECWTASASLGRADYRADYASLSASAS